MFCQDGSSTLQSRDVGVANVSTLESRVTTDTAESFATWLIESTENSRGSGAPSYDFGTLSFIPSHSGTLGFSSFNKSRSVVERNAASID